MAIQVDKQAARYHGAKTGTAKVLLCGQWFDLGMADTHRAVELASAKAVLQSLYDRAGSEPVSVDEYLEEVGELVARCKEITGWREPPKRDRQFGRRRAFTPSTSWRTI